MNVVVVRYLKPFSACLLRGELIAGSDAFVTCQLAFENNRPLRYKRGRKLFSGRVLGYAEDFVIVKADNLKRYRVTAAQIEAVNQ
jgi:hypothetical protein